MWSITAPGRIFILISPTPYPVNFQKDNIYTMRLDVNSCGSNYRLENTKESTYTYDDHCTSYTNHTYSGQLLVKSDVYQGDVHFREIKRTYDKNNNLIILESNELSMYSSAMSVVLRYEYYEEI